MRDHTILSHKRVYETGPVTRLVSKKRKDACSKRRNSFKKKVQKIDELTTQLQEISEEVRDLLVELPTILYNHDDPFHFVVRSVSSVLGLTHSMYEDARDSYRRSEYGAFSNSESDVSEE